METLDVSQANAPHDISLLQTLEAAPEDSSIVQSLRGVAENISAENYQESYHRAIALKREGLMLFSFSNLSLTDRAKVEMYFGQVCTACYDLAAKNEYMPDELAGLERILAATYYCNFSIFQSVPDHWAIKQLFPVCPLQRLNQKPSVQAILADITCDSDGVMDRFIDLREVKNTLPLHPLKDNEPYYLGIFLVGAYQEVLGDLHNLFGDTTIVHVSAGETGYVIEKTLEGDKIADVLGYVGYSQAEIIERYQRLGQEAIQEKRLNSAQVGAIMQHLEAMLADYTYLDTRG
jgi:arginine decarboxylase